MKFTYLIANRIVLEGPQSVFSRVMGVSPRNLQIRLREKVRQLKAE